MQRITYEYELIKTLTTKGKITNRYPFSGIFSHKDMFARYMKVAQKLDGSCDFVPPSFLLPQDLGELKSYMKENKGACFIAKPRNSGEGDGLILFRELK